ncbi:colanic acid biosynthesis glycosyltransferase WcaL [Vibrio sp. SM6]|uniref:Colanic acid biosynthesis glycosyltransferase WcaL n=1 Tax=Vibrio agarilyticus TaxID=2726741 RepID=A0A7X8TRG9_9VIBR|nr:glycosyltransferase [Vibrio agarilyticus]NLS13439.1 colanic acid biosynthesis glycosyltransferase WcaL [Vibrio agarilyticus]
MKNVAFVAPSYPVLSETFIRTEVEAIQNCGHHVTVMAFELHPWHEPLNHEMVDLTRSNRMEMFQHISPKGLKRALRFIHSQKSLPRRSLFKYGLKLALHCAERDIHHLHAHFCQHTAAHAIVAAKLLGITVSFVAHGHDVYETAFDIKEKINACDFVVTVCQEMQKDFQHLAKKDIKLLHCGVKVDEFRSLVSAKSAPRDSSLRLVFLGRLVEQKGVHYLFQALATMAQRDKIELDIVGTGEMENELKSMVIALGLSSQVRFLGAQPHAWVKRHLADYDGLVAPFCFSQTGCVDTGPLVLKEAMAVGIPVVTTTIMGCKEIVTAESGFLVPERDVEQLAQALTTFVALKPEQRIAMGQAARQRVENRFNADIQAQQLSHWIECAGGQYAA